MKYARGGQGSLEEGLHYQTAHYYKLGSNLVQTVLDMFQPDMDLATTVYRELEIIHGSVASANGVDTSETPGSHAESLDEVFEYLHRELGVYRHRCVCDRRTPFSLCFFWSRWLSRFA